MDEIIPVTKHIQYFMEKFPEVTKEECDFVEDILKWPDEKRAAFFMAKKMFEDKGNEK